MISFNLGFSLLWIVGRYQGASLSVKGKGSAPFGDMGILVPDVSENVSVGLFRRFLLA